MIDQINIGAQPNDGTGDGLRVAFNKTNVGLAQLLGLINLNILPTTYTFATLPPAVLNPTTLALTSDEGLVFSNGSSWMAVGTDTGPSNLLPGVYTYATLPPAVANPNVFASTTDKYGVYSDGSQWLLLYNITNATIGISNNTPLPGAVNGTAYTDTLTATNISGSPTWSIVSSFGSANTWALDPVTGILSGTPGTTETDTLMIQVSDATGAAIQKLFTITVAGSSLTPAATPTFSPVAGTYSVSQTVTITTTTSGASIYYTANGSTPTTSSTPYTGPVTVGTTGTLKAIAVKSGLANSAIGSAAYTITTAGAQYKFNPGVYPMTIAYQQGSGSTQVTSDLSVLAAHPIPTAYAPGGNQAYVVGFNQNQLESGSTNNNLVSDAVNGVGQYAGFTSVLQATLTRIWTSNPTMRVGISILSNSYGNNYTANFIKTAHWDTLGKIAPYIANCAGTLRAYASLGSSSFVDYPVAPLYSGSSYYGFALGGWTGTILSEFTPAFWNPGVNQCKINFWEALSKFVLQAGPWAGMTLDQCPNIEFILVNDEWSYAMLAGFNPTDAGGVTVNPPQSTTSTNQPTKANAYAADLLFYTKACGFFPHTQIFNNYSYGFGAGYGSADTPADVAGYINNLISGNGLSGITGFGASGADTYGTDWRADGSAPWYADNAKQGYAGITTPVQGSSGPGTVTSAHALALKTPKLAQWQPTDYSARYPTGVAVRSQAVVQALALASNNSFVKSGYYIMCMGDGSTFGNTAYTSYGQPAMVTGITGPSTVRPSNLP